MKNVLLNVLNATLDPIKNLKAVLHATHAMLAIIIICMGMLQKLIAWNALLDHIVAQAKANAPNATQDMPIQIQ